MNFEDSFISNNGNQDIMNIRKILKDEYGINEKIIYITEE